jgi:hypothetical protein
MTHHRRTYVHVALVLASLLPVGARADYRSEKNLKLQPGGEFVIDASAGSVSVKGTAQSGAHIVITSNHDDLERLFDISFDETAHGVRVTARRREAFHSIHNLRLDFAVEVPADTRVEVKTGGGAVRASNLGRDVDLRTSGGAISASGLGADLAANTSGGGIDLRDVKGNSRVDTSGGAIEGSGIGGRLDARTSGGSIRLDRVGGDLLAHTSGGSIQIDEAGGRVDAETSGGSVEVRFAKGNARGGEVSTSGGGVRVAVDRGVGLDIDASASSGSVSTDLPLTVTGTISKSHLRGTLGSGGALLRLHSDGGPVHLESL